MKKIRIFLDIEKELDWLKEMDLKGWECTNVNALGVFSFSKKDSITKHYQIDFQEFPRKSKFEDYVKFHEEFNWKLIGGSWTSGKYYWQSNAADNESLFSDNSSERHFYRRALNQYLSLTVVFTVLYFIVNQSIDISIVNWRDAFYTPGLWETSGSLFLKKFLFELPFACMRLGFHLIILVFAVYNLVIMTKIQSKLSELNKKL